jgi:hypothetical protein
MYKANITNRLSNIKSKMLRVKGTPPLYFTETYTDTKAFNIDLDLNKNVDVSDAIKSMGIKYSVDVKTKELIFNLKDKPIILDMINKQCLKQYGRTATIIDSTIVNNEWLTSVLMDNY